MRGSFVPAEPIRRLRDLTRLRTHLRQEQSRDKHRLEKVLEDAGIKLGVVASDVTGVSARAMLAVLSEGLAPQELAGLAQRRLKSKTAELADALDGRFTGHHGFMAGLLLDRIDRADADIERIEEQIDGLMGPFQRAKELLSTIPGVSSTIAETGADMSVFPDAKHLVSWSGCAPGMHESTGKKKSSATRPGNSYLKGALGVAALAASRMTTTHPSSSSGGSPPAAAQ